LFTYFSIGSYTFCPSLLHTIIFLPLPPK
jgi:hypothetical protein